MAGDWIKLDYTTPDKPEIFQMADLLGLDEDTVVGKLTRLWIWADQNTIAGEPIAMSAARLDRMLRCEGFAGALRSVGWLAGEDGALRLPNFEHHNGETGKARAMNNRRMAKHRAGQLETRSERIKEARARKERSHAAESVDLADPVDSMDSMEEPGQAETAAVVEKIGGLVMRNAGVTLAPLQKALPEERREEEKEEDSLRSSSSSSGPGGAVATWSPDEGWRIPDEVRERWRIAYPACDIDRHAAVAHEWLLARPHKRKKRHHRFLNNWLDRHQEKGGDVAMHTAPRGDAGSPTPPEQSVGSGVVFSPGLAELAAKHFANGSQRGGGPPQESTWSLTQRIDAARRRIESIKARESNWHYPAHTDHRILCDEAKAEVRQLKANIEVWERQPTAVG